MNSFTNYPTGPPTATAAPNVITTRPGQNQGRPSGTLSDLVVHATTKSTNVGVAENFVAVGCLSTGVSTTPDQLIDDIASRQFGAFGRGQALTCGHTSTTIARRLASGRWIKLHSGIYAVAGSHASWERHALAAQLMAGPGDGLSHLSAAYILGMSELRPHRIDLSTPRQIRADGIRLHRRELDATNYMRFAAFVVTAPERTLLDVASILDSARLEDCVEEALHRRLLNAESLAEWLKQMGSQGRRGGGRLRSLLALRNPSSAPTATNFETLLQRILRKAKLPPPQRQVPVFDEEGFITRLDFAYVRERLGIPPDSYLWHARRRNWERDIEQRNRLTRIGWRLRPTTWTELKNGDRRYLRTIFPDSWLRLRKLAEMHVVETSKSAIFARLGGEALLDVLRQHREQCVQDQGPHRDRQRKYHIG